MKQHSDQRNFKDPVCGMELSRKTAVEECVYQGTSCYFCAAICRKIYSSSPPASDAAALSL